MAIGIVFNVVVLCISPQSRLWHLHEQETTIILLVLVANGPSGNNLIYTGQMA